MSRSSSVPVLSIISPNEAIAGKEVITGHWNSTLNLMKEERKKFPVVREAKAMSKANTAPPKWAEGEVCFQWQCRVAFRMMTRQHHCRACGQVFCHNCSSKSCRLPKFGIEREVCKVQKLLKAGSYFSSVLNLCSFLF